MPPSDKPYLIDTDVFEHIRFHPDSKKIYEGVVALAKPKKIRTVHQVFGELKKLKEAHGVLAPYEKDFCIEASLQYCKEVQEKLELLKNHAPFLWAITGGKNPDPADPWLVAVSAAHGYTVVTDEKPESPKKIPAACRVPQIACRCITGPHFLIEVGLVTEIKPEHISPQAFFGIGQGGRG